MLGIENGCSEIELCCGAIGAGSRRSAVVVQYEYLIGVEVIRMVVVAIVMLKIFLIFATHFRSPL